MSPRQSPAKKVPVKSVTVMREAEPWDGQLETEEATEPVAPPRTSLRLYRHLAVGFVLLVAAILGVVLYVSLVKATIRVTPVEETISSEVLLDVVKTPTREQEIKGVILSGTVARTQTATPSGEGAVEVEGTAKGTVTIYNTTNSNQALVVRTRLLTPEGVLFRIDEDVNVPAGGSVQVAAHADVPGASGDIGPSRFTIPGLSAALQEVIYAESTQPFTGGISMVAAISQNDIDRAYADLKTALEEDAKAMLRQESGGGFGGESFGAQVVSQSSTVEPGSEAASFDVTMELLVTGVFFDREAAEVLAVRALYDMLPPGKEFATVNSEGMQATVEKTDVENGTANVRVYLDGLATTSITSPSLQPGRFAGMKEDKVRQTLAGEGIAQDVQIDFFPGWIKTVPRLKDHIYVEIE